MSAAHPVTASPEVDAIAERVREAAARGTVLRVRGGGTWLDAGRPVKHDAVLEAGALRGVIEYVPGDLTITAHAGATLGELARTTAAHGQWLALDPFGRDEGTVGATVATASCGPLAATFGGPRDQVLGLEFVTGEGNVARGGGRVVKNVAGFDLVRLLTGAWGTLGVITEVTLRLRAQPQHDVTLAAPVATDPVALQQMVAALRALPFQPYAAELLDATLATRVGASAKPLLLVRLGGSDASVRAQRDAVLHALGPHLRGSLEERGDDPWPAVRGAEPAGAAAVRFSARPSGFPGTWDEAQYVAARVPGAFTCGSPMRGVVRACLPGEEASLKPALTGRRASASCARVYERLPASLWARLAPSAVGDRLSQGVHRAFDPRATLNRGILGARAE